MISGLFWVVVLTLSTAYLEFFWYNGGYDYNEPVFTV